MKKLIFVCAALLLLIVTGCKKEVIGPAGPQGPAGNANIINYTLSTTTASWTYNSSGKSYTAMFVVPDLTAAIAQYGVVQLYEVGTGGSYVALPYSIFDIEYNYEYGTGYLYIYATPGSTNLDYGNPGNMQFKLVLMPKA